MKLTGANLILVNVAATYGRTLLGAALSLFSSRWVLRALGHEDYGLYSVVGGLIVFVAFVGNTLAGGAQRFFAYSIGKGDSEDVCRWFNTAFALYGGFAVVVVALGVPVGQYVIDHVLQIPEARRRACHVIYYLSVLGMVSTMVSAPYSGMFRAKQWIFELSLWEILQVGLSFSLAWYLLSAQGDLLVVYACGMVCIKWIGDGALILRARRLFKECRLRTGYWGGTERVKRLLSFSVWLLFGNAGMVARNQGMSLVINLFSGARVNAAFGIANQVSAQTAVLSTAIYTAIAPEIISQEGAGKRDAMISLSLRSTRLTVLVTLLWLVPVFAEVEYILDVWLENVPLYCPSFCRIVLLAYLVDKLSIGYQGAVNAHGNIRGYQAMLGGALILTFPLAWLMYTWHGNPHWAVGMLVVTGAMCSLGRVWWVKRLMGVPMRRWFVEVPLRCIVSALPAMCAALLVMLLLPMSLLRFGVVSVTTVLATALSFWVWGFRGEERDFVRRRGQAAWHHVLVQLGSGVRWFGRALRIRG